MNHSYPEDKQTNKQKKKKKKKKKKEKDCQYQL